MDRPKALGIVVLGFASLAAYLALANLLDFLGWVYLPLGTLGTDNVLLFVLLSVAFVSLLVVRQSKSGRTLG